MMKRSKYKDYLIAIIAALISALNYRLFVEAGDLVPGGFNGIAVFTTRLMDRVFDIQINYSFLYFALNIPCVLLVLKSVGKHFTTVSVLYTAIYTIAVQFIPQMHITDDLLLISIFGAIINGFACSLVILANGCAGGTDFISIYIGKKYHRTVWSEVMGVNVIVLIISGLTFNWEAVLYSIIYQYVATQIINMRDKRYSRSTFIIVSDKADEIAKAVSADELHHTVTMINGVGGFTNKDRKIIYTVVGDYEIQLLEEIIYGIDEKAFVNIIKTDKILGNFHEKPYF